MNTIFLVLAGVICNALVGAGVWAAIDDKDQRLFRWYKACPEEVSWFVQPIILMGWPYALWLWWRWKTRGTT